MIAGNTTDGERSKGELDVCFVTLVSPSEYRDRFPLLC